MSEWHENNTLVLPLLVCRPNNDQHAHQPWLCVRGGVHRL